MDGNRGDLAELVKKKRNTDYDFLPQFTNEFVGAENTKFQMSLNSLMLGFEQILCSLVVVRLFDGEKKTK